MLPRSLEREAGAAGAAHAERVPFERALERVIVLEEHHQHLVRTGRLARAAGRGDDAVGLRPVGNDGRGALEGDFHPLGFDRGSAGPDVAAVLSFRGGGGQQQLLGRQAAQHALVPGIAAAVPDHAGDLRLVHGEDHGRRRTGAAELVADVHHLAEAGALPAEIAGNHHAEQPLLPRRIDRLGREP